MRENCTPGSVRGPSGNWRSYRDGGSDELAGRGAGVGRAAEVRWCDGGESLVVGWCGNTAPVRGCGMCHDSAPVTLVVVLIATVIALVIPCCPNMVTVTTLVILGL